MMIDCTNVVGRACVIANEVIDATTTTTNCDGNLCVPTTLQSTGTDENAAACKAPPKRYVDEAFPVSFHKKRHQTAAVSPAQNENLATTKATSKTWRIRDRVSVACDFGR